MSFDKLTYEDYFGLSLNAERVHGRLMHAMFRALNASRSSQLSAAFFEAVSSSREEAEDMAFSWNASMYDAQVAAEFFR